MSKIIPRISAGDPVIVKTKDGWVPRVFVEACILNEKISSLVGVTDELGQIVKYERYFDQEMKPAPAPAPVEDIDPKAWLCYSDVYTYTVGDKVWHGTDASHAGPTKATWSKGVITNVFFQYGAMEVRFSDKIKGLVYRHNMRPRFDPGDEVVLQGERVICDVCNDPLEGVYTLRTKIGKAYYEHVSPFQMVRADRTEKQMVEDEYLPGFENHTYKIGDRVYFGYDAAKKGPVRVTWAKRTVDCVSEAGVHTRNGVGDAFCNKPKDLRPLFEIGDYVNLLGKYTGEILAISDTGLVTGRILDGFHKGDTFNKHPHELRLSGNREAAEDAPITPPAASPNAPRGKKLDGSDYRYFPGDKVQVATGGTGTPGVVTSVLVETNSVCVYRVRSEGTSVNERLGTHALRPRFDVGDAVKYQWHITDGLEYSGVIKEVLHTGCCRVLMEEGPQAGFVSNIDPYRLRLAKEVVVPMSVKLAEEAVLQNLVDNIRYQPRDIMDQMTRDIMDHRTRDVMNQVDGDIMRHLSREPTEVESLLKLIGGVRAACMMSTPKAIGTCTARIRLGNGQELEIPAPAGMTKSFCEVYEKPRPIKVDRERWGLMGGEQRLSIYIGHVEGRCWLKDMFSVINSDPEAVLLSETHYMGVGTVGKDGLVTPVTPVVEKQAYAVSYPLLKEYLW